MEAFIAYHFNTSAGRIQYVAREPGKGSKEWIYTQDIREAARLSGAALERFRQHIKKLGSRAFDMPVEVKKVEKIKTKAITEFITQTKERKPAHLFIPSARILGANAEAIKEHALKLNADGIGACRVIRETVRAFPAEGNSLLRQILCEHLKLNPGTVNRQIALERRELAK